MPFVKLDCGILNSSLWATDPDRVIFITALLMAEPYSLEEAQPQIEADSLNPTGWSVPAGWYGFIRASGTGILRRAGVGLEDGMKALSRLGSPELESRSKEFDGRRLVRVDGGYIVLNYMKYREFDTTAAARMRVYRQRKALRVTPVTLQRTVTEADAEAEADADAEREGSSPSPSVEAERPSLKEWSEYCQRIGLADMAYAKDKFLAAEADNWSRKDNWRAYAARCRTWWESERKSKRLDYAP